MKIVVSVPETVPLSVCEVNQRSVDDEPDSGLGDTVHDWELSHQFVVALEVSVGANDRPNWVQVRLGAEGVPPPLIEYE